MAAPLINIHLELSSRMLEPTGGRRNRVFAYQQYLSVLSEGTETI
ncbi:MAG: hypothetical protein ABIJ52_04990 [Pseudomonadota bacterium]